MRYNYLDMFHCLLLRYVSQDRLAAVEYKRAADLAVEVEGYGVEKAAHYNLNAAQIFLESGKPYIIWEATISTQQIYTFM